MKQFLLFFVMMIISGLGCSESNPVGSTSINTMKATISGEDWTGFGSGVKATRFGKEYVSVSGWSKNDTKAITITLEGISQPGEYKIEGENEFMLPRFASYMPDTSDFFAEKGILKILEISKNNAKGQFNFIAINRDRPNAPDTVIITNGEFNVAF